MHITGPDDAKVYYRAAQKLIRWSWQAATRGNYQRADYLMQFASNLVRKSAIAYRVDNQVQ